MKCPGVARAGFCYMMISGVGLTLFLWHFHWFKRVQNSSVWTSVGLWVCRRKLGFLSLIDWIEHHSWRHALLAENCQVTRRTVLALYKYALTLWGREGPQLFVLNILLFAATIFLFANTCNGKAAENTGILFHCTVQLLVFGFILPFMLHCDVAKWIFYQEPLFIT